MTEPAEKRAKPLQQLQHSAAIRIAAVLRRAGVMQQLQHNPLGVLHVLQRCGVFLLSSK